jgi:O-acetyl-ADP-ribose deacetylase (regulator of RNase III)
MIKYVTGNLLEAEVEALVNTVNTVGVMGKGIALMFRERFPENFRAYASACKTRKIEVGKMFVTPSNELSGPRWIVNFPTKQHWRYPSKPEWIENGLRDLCRVIAEKEIKSIALPPLGCGNGGLDWAMVKEMIEVELSNIPNLQVVAYEPTKQYQNVAKRTGVQTLTVPRALIAEAVRRYWVLGIECTLLEIHKLAWFLERSIVSNKLKNDLNLEFGANRYGPYSQKLNHLLNALDGSFLRSSKRIADCDPSDTIAFAESKRDKINVFLSSGEAKDYQVVLDQVDELIDGFQSPYGLELLATVDWLLFKEQYEPTVTGVRKGLQNWKGGIDAGVRKQRLFDDEILQLAIERLQKSVITA